MCNLRALSTGQVGNLGSQGWSAQLLRSACTCVFNKYKERSLWTQRAG